MPDSFQLHATVHQQSDKCLHQCQTWDNDCHLNARVAHSTLLCTGRLRQSDFLYTGRTEQDLRIAHLLKKHGLYQVKSILGKRTTPLSHSANSKPHFYLWRFAIANFCVGCQDTIYTIQTVKPVCCICRYCKPLYTTLYSVCLNIVKVSVGAWCFVGTSYTHTFGTILKLVF